MARSEIGDYMSKDLDISWGGSSIDSMLSSKHVPEMHGASSKTAKIESGTRVRFSSTLSSLLHYANTPDTDVFGTVVLVKTASGHTTVSPDGRTYVKWDDNVFRAIRAEHLIPVRIKKSHAQHFADFSAVSSSFSVVGDDELIHKATKDLWSFSKDREGGYKLERLFDETGKPIKA